MTIWVVIPAYNEVESLPAFLPEIISELTDVDPRGRVLVVDDGSTDGSDRVLADLEQTHPQLRTTHQGRNLGKARALQRGFSEALDAGADIVVMMDADGQDDPKELPTLLRALDTGHDLVSGARRVRRDRFVKRTTSRFYNKVTQIVGGAPVTDNNTGFKVMRRAVVQDLVPMMYGELHRYITVIAHWSGYSVSEVQVRHHPRRFGRTKYGLSRFWRGFLDLLTVRFLLGYESRPFHLFGMLGLCSAAAGTVVLIYLTVLWVLGSAIGQRPLLPIGILLIVAGLQLLLFGLLAELVVFASNRQAAERRRPDPTPGADSHPG